MISNSYLAHQSAGFLFLINLDFLLLHTAHFDENIIFFEISESLNLIWVGRVVLLPPLPSPWWYPSNNSEKVKAVTLELYSIQ